MRGTLTVLTLLSVVLFPWPVVVLLALCSAPLLPLLPLAAGLFADVLYYVPAAHTLPLATLLGAAVSIGMYFVRNRLKTSIIA